MVKTNYSEWDKSDLIKEVKKLKKQKKYGIVWDLEKTKETFEKNPNNYFPVLSDIKSKEIQSISSKQFNFLIEGDNYHALSVLNYTHEKKIDTMYIDPPYNLGDDSFKYNDKIVDKEDSYRHSKWLSFMNKRLKLAKNLLSRKGAIFISIGDNEQAQLKLLCNEIFGEENFIATFVWEKRTTRENRRVFSFNHDYILCYAKNKNSFESYRNQLPLSEEVLSRYSNPDNDSRGNWQSVSLNAQAGHATSSQFYELHTPGGRVLSAPSGRCWSVTKIRMNELIKDNRVWFGENGNNVPRLKSFLSEASSGLTPHTLWTAQEVGTNDSAKKKLIEMFEGKSVFETPKPIELIKRILQIASDKNSIVLDFFAGSGVMGHAVLELNKEDNGNRKFILCTNNENGICSEVCYPRVKKVIHGYSNSKKKKVPGVKGNLKYFKTGFVENVTTDRKKKKMVENCTEMLCLREDCFDEVKITKNFKIFKNHSDRYLGIIYDDEGIESFKNQIVKINQKVSTYVFSLDDSAREEEFEEILDLVDLKPIPEVILNVYRRIFR
jgi:adenine-specific DNA-methyltransferase